MPVKGVKAGTPLFIGDPSRGLDKCRLHKAGTTRGNEVGRGTGSMAPVTGDGGDTHVQRAVTNRKYGRKTRENAEVRGPGRDGYRTPR